MADQTHADWLRDFARSRRIADETSARLRTIADDLEAKDVTIAALTADRDRLQEELQQVLQDWNALRAAIGSPTNGGAVGHARVVAEKAAAYDAGVQGWAIKSGSAFHWVSDTDFVPKAHLSHWPGSTVVPVRIVEVKEPLTTPQQIPSRPIPAAPESGSPATSLDVPPPGSTRS